MADIDAAFAHSPQTLASRGLVRTNPLAVPPCGPQKVHSKVTDITRVVRLQLALALFAMPPHRRKPLSSLLRCWRVLARVTSNTDARERFPSQMHNGNSIVMHAPRMAIFETAANLELWPKILPHYRYIHYLERSAGRNIVMMGAVRSGIPIAWTSEQIIDRANLEVRFHHLKAFTKGMRVVWTFNETPAGVLVEIVHDLQFRLPALAPIADQVIGNFFIHHVANETLRHMKTHLEARG